MSTLAFILMTSDTTILYSFPPNMFIHLRTYNIPLFYMYAVSRPPYQRIYCIITVQLLVHKCHDIWIQSGNQHHGPSWSLEGQLCINGLIVCASTVPLFLVDMHKLSTHQKASFQGYNFKNTHDASQTLT